ncbi:hypothetical protein EVA_12116 [gut metagenome]|uniref:Uncharacterized protein n=1 Tax=gut metagenome TaxID=749906 RepID=J9CI92_9ZZZZ
MFHFIKSIFILLILIFIAGIAIIIGYIHNLFKTNKRTSRNQESSSSLNEQSSDKEEKHHSMNKKKVFSKDEGEYVDFEEI